MLRVRLQGRHSIGDWNDLRYALAVATMGSFHGAAKLIKTHETTVARRVQRLEAELGAKLFVRESRGMRLTAAGVTLVEKAADIEEAAVALQRSIAGMDARISGVVRISVPEGIGAYWLVPVLAEFQRAYPGISVEIFTTLLPVGLGNDEVDVALAIARPTNDRLAISRVGDVHYRLFCSKSYLAENGAPRTVAELAQHKLLRLTIYETDAQFKWWSAVTKAAVHRPLSSNSTSLYVTAVRAGIGIGMFADFYRAASNDLVILPLVPRCKTTFWLVSHAETNKGAKVRVLLDFLKEKLAEARGTWLG